MSWEAIIIGIGAAMLEFFLKPIQKAVVPFLKKRVEEKFRKNQKGVYEKKVAIAALLALIEEQEGVIKAVQIQTKNGGGIPRANTPIYGSIVAPVKYSDTFSSQLLDSQYCDMIGKLISQKRITFLTNEIPDGILKDLLLAQGIVACVYYDACISKSDYNFIAIDLSVPPAQLTPETRDDIRQYINEIIKLLNA